MDIELMFRPGYSAARLMLAGDEAITAEAGAMIAMSGAVGIETTTHQRSGGGGVLKAMKRLLAGESFFLNHFKAPASGGEVWVATTLPGDMETFDLDHRKLIVQAGSFVACEQTVQMDMGWQGMKSMFSGEGLFWLHMTGHGKMVLSSFGAIYPMAVDGEFIVDTGHIVAFEDTLTFNITKAGGSWMTAILGGEGLVCRFSGKGTVWCQSHNPSAFGQALGPKLRARV
jgi:uncharacterized protein (TIGR00266 family)